MHTLYKISSDLVPEKTSINQGYFLCPSTHENVSVSLDKCAGELANSTGQFINVNADEEQ